MCHINKIFYKLLFQFVILFLYLSEFFVLVFKVNKILNSKNILICLKVLHFIKFSVSKILPMLKNILENHIKSF